MVKLANFMYIRKIFLVTCNRVVPIPSGISTEIVILHEKAKQKREIKFVRLALRFRGNRVSEFVGYTCI